MNCATAEAAARFAQDVVSPAAQQVFGQTLKSITHASAYVCRPRNGTQKLSEHAFGNALDIASFTLSDGTTVAVELTPAPKSTALFLGKVRSAACGPFKTVLGPGRTPTTPSICISTSRRAATAARSASSAPQFGRTRKLRR